MKPIRKPRNLKTKYPENGVLLLPDSYRQVIVFLQLLAERGCACHGETCYARVKRDFEEYGDDTMCDPCEAKFLLDRWWRKYGHDVAKGLG